MDRYRYASTDLGLVLCKMLDIDPTRTKALSLSLRSGEMAVVTIEQWVDTNKEGLAELATVLSTYTLQPLETEDG